MASAADYCIVPADRQSPCRDADPRGARGRPPGRSSSGLGMRRATSDVLSDRRASGRPAPCFIEATVGRTTFGTAGPAHGPRAVSCWFPPRKQTRPPRRRFRRKGAVRRQRRGRLLFFINGRRVGERNGSKGIVPSAVEPRLLCPRPELSRRGGRTAASARRCTSRTAQGHRHPPRYWFSTRWSNLRTRVDRRGSAVGVIGSRGLRGWLSLADRPSTGERHR